MTDGFRFFCFAGLSDESLPSAGGALTRATIQQQSLRRDRPSKNKNRGLHFLYIYINISVFCICLDGFKVLAFLCSSFSVKFSTVASFRPLLKCIVGCYKSHKQNMCTRSFSIFFSFIICHIIHVITEFDKNLHYIYTVYWTLKRHQ